MAGEGALPASSSDIGVPFFKNTSPWRCGLKSTGHHSTHWLLYCQVNDALARLMAEGLAPEPGTKVLAQLNKKGLYQGIF